MTDDLPDSSPADRADARADARAGATGDIEALERVLAERWSCRGYLPEPVDDATLERLLEAARCTPSWCNTQPWRVDVLSGDAARELSAAMLAGLEQGGSDLDFPQAYTGVHRDRRRESGWQLYDAVGIEKGDRDRSFLEGLRNFELFGAPHVAIISAPRELGTYGAIDCGLYVQTFLLAAQALGLGACAQAALAGQSSLLHEHLDIPEDRAVVCGISFGRPDPDHPTASYRTSRAPLAETVTRRG